MPGLYNRNLFLKSLTWILSRENLVSLREKHQVITHLGVSRSSGGLRCHYIAQ